MILCWGGFLGYIIVAGGNLTEFLGWKNWGVVHSSLWARKNKNHSVVSGSNNRTDVHRTKIEQGVKKLLTIPNP